MTVYNFGAGPAMLPLEVREQAHREWFNWNNTGVSVAELSHRDPAFRELLDEINTNLRQLMQIPANYKILYLQGGAQGVFAGVPMNLLGGKNKQADYLTYGLWSRKAAMEAERYGDIKAQELCTEAEPFILRGDWQPTPGAAYLHYCTNETIDGMRFVGLPETEAPLVADMSSDFLSEPVDVERFGVIYGCAQKNLGTAGITLVIVREDLLGHAMPEVPSILNWEVQASMDSLYNTLPTFAVYVTGLVVKWVMQRGGLEAMAAHNQRQAAVLYNTIEELGGFYHSKVAPEFRSLMNVPFFLPNEELEQLFLVEAKQQGLLFLKGHRTRGGIRASIYNAMPDEGVKLLAEFMRDFAQRKG